MDFVVENGTLLHNGNAYASVAFVNQYLTQRNRFAQNNWSGLSDTVKQAHIVSATEYIDVRWGPRFKGQKAKFIQGELAVAEIEFLVNPNENDAVSVANSVYTFVSSVDNDTPNQVLIGVSISESINNLIAAINASLLPGAFSSSTVPHAFVVASPVEGSQKIKVTSQEEGDGGNFLEISTSAVATFSLKTFSGGIDEGRQPLEFPREYLYDCSGFLISGIPLKLRQATAEYAVRSAGGELLPDPAIDATAGNVTKSKRKLGPLEIETQFEEGTTLVHLLKPYPLADRLLQDFVQPSGRVFR